MWRFAAGVLGVVASAGAFAMDCTKAATPVERLVCASPRLQALDLRLNDAFRVAAVVATDATALRDEQRRWLATRDACGDEVCVAAAYGERVAVLAGRVPVRDVWLRTMPAQFRDGWQFYGLGPEASPFAPGEPVWVVNPATVRDGSPRALSRQFFDIATDGQNRKPFQAKAGTKVRVYGFYRGQVMTGQVVANEGQRLTVSVAGSRWTLARTPKSLTATTRVHYPTIDGRATYDDAFGKSFSGDSCQTFDHVTEVRIPDRAATPPAWIASLDERVHPDVESLCRDPDLRFKYDDYFGPDSGFSWGDDGAQVLSDGSALLMSSSGEQVHVLRIRADGSVPQSESSRIKIVPWERLDRLRAAALKGCRVKEEAQDRPDDFSFTKCLVEAVEKGL
ncbi:lysozyme inhibitor LprI family protein [Roseateles sp. L2-2]|uniref:lysozyme inhibitor LprI family protein n=1 Tax=Roseateles sp. L2-2 TaxID=3422597 RepID=UPI003D35A103